jgi:hypothetical protein
MDVWVEVREQGRSPAEVRGKVTILACQIGFGEI